MLRHFRGGCPSYQTFSEMPLFPTVPPSPILPAACFGTESRLHWGTKAPPCLVSILCPWPSGVLDDSCSTAAGLDPLPWEDLLPVPTFLLPEDLPRLHQDPKLQLRWGAWSLWCLLRTMLFLGCVYMPSLKLHFFTVPIFCVSLLECFWDFIPFCCSPIVKVPAEFLTLWHAF